MELYHYCISGWFWAGAEYRHFDEEVDARTSSDALELVVGRLAWKINVWEEKSFKLDVIHYEVI